MSFQRHFKRNEIWLISKGSCVVSYFNDQENDEISQTQLKKFDHYFVPIGNWHQIKNLRDDSCHIIEIQYGEDCIESDIERINKF